MAALEAQLKAVSHKEDLTTPAPWRAWTSPDAYIEAMARKRTARRSRRERQRTEPEAPRLLLSTLPFLALIIFMAVLTVAIMVAAMPGSAPQPKAPQIAQHEQGVAAKGWFQEAQKEFH